MKKGRKKLSKTLLIGTIAFFSLFKFSTTNAKLEEGGGWFWQSKEIDCTVTITYGGGPIPFAYSETYPGKKRICEDGWSICLLWDM